MLFFLILGLIIGSFINVCIYRIPMGKSIVFPSSHCFKCGTRLRALDLVPVFSYLAFKGKCRYCGEGISLQYPIIELLSGIIYMFIYLRFGIGYELIFILFLSSILLTITVIDYFHKIIPDGLNILILILSILYKFIFFEGWFIDSLMGFLLGGGILFVIAVISNGGMGGGDIKLMAALGIWFGWKWTLMVLLLSVVFGAIISILLITFKIKGRKDEIPFGPFIALGAFLMLTYGEAIYNYYIQLVLFNI